MDRDKRWDRVAKAYDAIVEAEGPHFADAQSAMSDAYAHDVTDEFVVPSVIGNYAGIKDGDGVLSFNFRADRVREILGAMLDPSFDGFTRKRSVRFAAAVGMTQYSSDLDRLMQTIFPPQAFPNILGEVTAAANRTQLRMAETEKYPHVTYFLNGGREEPFPGEDRIMVPSPKVATYDLQPEMSAAELTAKAVEAIDSGKYDLIVLNYANPDMVGHTGILAAAIKAVETVDTALGKISEAIQRSGGALLVTADHGNCEMMRDPVTGGPHTAHTTNPVPLLLQGGGDVTLAEGRLADIAPTLLDLMQLPKPASMTGMSLLRPKQASASSGLRFDASSNDFRSRRGPAHRPSNTKPGFLPLRPQRRLDRALREHGAVLGAVRQLDAFHRAGKDHAVFAGDGAAAQRRKTDIAGLARAGNAVASARRMQMQGRRRGPRRRPRPASGRCPTAHRSWPCDASPGFRYRNR